MEKSKKRAALQFDDLESIDISEIAQPKKKITNFEKAAIERVAEKSGFVKRSPSRRSRPKSSHVIQVNLKSREGVKEIFQDIGAQLGIFDHTTFERAIQALLEKEKLTNLLKEFKKIVTDAL